MLGSEGDLVSLGGSINQIEENVRDKYGRVTWTYVSRCVYHFCWWDLFARAGHAKVYMPGGCTIGERPIGFILRGFWGLWKAIIAKEDYIEATAPEQRSWCGAIHPWPSQAMTENTMMAAVLANGTTYIENAAQEPEIVILLTSWKWLKIKAGRYLIPQDWRCWVTTAAHNVLLTG